MHIRTPIWRQQDARVCVSKTIVYDKIVQVSGFINATCTFLVDDIPDFASLLADMNQWSVADNGTLGQVAGSKGSISSLADFRVSRSNMILTISILIQPLTKRNE
jgi:hypothetical protein